MMQGAQLPTIERYMLKECAVSSAFTYDERQTRVSPSVNNKSRLLASYLFNLERGTTWVREKMISDIRDFSDLGAHRQASELFDVLKCFLSRFPEAGPIEELCQFEGGELVLSALENRA